MRTRLRDITGNVQLYLSAASRGWLRMRAPLAEDGGGVNLRHGGWAPSQRQLNRGISLPPQYSQPREELLSGFIGGFDMAPERNTTKQTLYNQRVVSSLGETDCVTGLQ